MELVDFVYFIWVPLLLIPLTATYVSLRQLGWPNDRLFWDAWIVFWVIVVSSIVSLITLGLTTEIIGIYWSISWFWWGVLNFLGTFIFSFLFVLFVLIWKRRLRRKSSVDIFENRLSESVESPTIASASLVTSFVVVTTATLILGIIMGGQAVYDHYYPKPPVEFGIYDI